MHKLRILPLLLLGLITLGTTGVHAEGYKPNCCTDPIVDQDCVDLKSQDQSATCDVYYCEEDESGICASSSQERAFPIIIDDLIYRPTPLERLGLYGLILSVSFALLATVTSILIVIALVGFVRRITSEDKKKVESANKLIRNALKGVALGVLCLIIIQILVILTHSKNIVEAIDLFI